jgi:hypothetical protein
MAVTVVHPFVSAVADGGDASVVQPSDWNAGHTVTGLGTAATHAATDFDTAGAAATAQAAAIAASDTAGAAAAAQAASWPATTAFDATNPAAIGTATPGAAAKTAHRDHVHPTGAGTPSTQAFGDAASTGSGPAAAMTDHKHAMPANPVAYAAPALTFGTANAAGSAASAVRTDATILAFDTTVPVTQASGDAAAAGSATVAARRDHVHGMPTILSQAQVFARGLGS